MNPSKKRDPRIWKKWAKSGAVLPGNAVVRKIGSGMILLRFTKPISVKDAVASMERSGYRPAEVGELFYDRSAPSFINVPSIRFENDMLKLEFERNSDWNSPFSRFLPLR